MSPRAWPPAPFALADRSPSSSASARATPEDIPSAYRMILRRAPDPDGLRYYGRWVARGLSLETLVGSLMNSDEFRRRIVPTLPDEVKAGIRLRTLAEDAVSVDLGGYVVCVRPSDQDFGRAIVATCDYEPHVRRFLKESVHAGQVVVDVGANVGCLSFQAARLVGDRGRVIAIEPNPDNVQLLFAGIVMNGWRNVEVWPCAAWDAPGIMSLKGGGSNTYVVRAAPIGEGRAYTQLIRLDETLAHVDRVDLIKIDIEGHEPHAIRGARGLIEKHRPTLLTEFNPRCLRAVGGIPPRAYAEQLLSHYSRLRVLTVFGDDAEFRSADSLIRYWEKRDRELAREGILAEGMLQFDVVATMD
ncbi:MAG TPA: FkbM family methyltransferase [Methylomirabilota bacterium]|jgi:FkbM family methyltransferase